MLDASYVSKYTHYVCSTAPYMFMPTGKQDGSMRSGIFPEGFCMNVGWRWRYVRRRPIDAEVLPGHVATSLCSSDKIR